MINALVITAALIATGAWLTTMFGRLLLQSSREGRFPARGIVYTRREHPVMFPLSQAIAIVMCLVGGVMILVGVMFLWMMLTEPDAFRNLGNKR